METETITIAKKEYQSLAERALRYDFLVDLVQKKEDIFAPPIVKDTKRVIQDFRATKLYTSAFLKSLEKGLKRSSYFNNGK